MATRQSSPLECTSRRIRCPMRASAARYRECTRGRGLPLLRSLLFRGDLHFRVVQNGTQAKVRELRIAIRADEDVIGLEVVVQDAEVVQVLQTQSHLAEQLPALVGVSLALQIRSQVSIAGKLADKEYFANAASAIQIDDMRVAQREPHSQLVEEQLASVV